MFRPRFSIPDRALQVVGWIMIAGSSMAIGHLAYGQEDPCPDVPEHGCSNTVLVPCQNATCVAWTTAYPGSNAPACPDNPNSSGTSFSCTVTATGWNVCGSNGTNPNVSCTSTLTTCGTYTFYTDSYCTMSCGTQSMGFCRGTANAACPMVTPPDQP